MVEDISLYSLCLLFANSFLAATILPFGSEATFIGLLSRTDGGTVSVKQIKIDTGYSLYAVQSVLKCRIR